MLEEHLVADWDFKRSIGKTVCLMENSNGLPFYRARPYVNFILTIVNHVLRTQKMDKCVVHSNIEEVY